MNECQIIRGPKAKFSINPTPPGKYSEIFHVPDFIVTALNFQMDSIHFPSVTTIWKCIQNKQKKKNRCIFIKIFFFYYNTISWYLCLITNCQQSSKRKAYTFVQLYFYLMARTIKHLKWKKKKIHCDKF